MRPTRKCRPTSSSTRIGAEFPRSTFEFLRGDAVLGRSVAELPAPDPDGRIKYVASFPTTIFEPGAYRLRAVATLDGRTSTSDVSFTIVP